MLIAPLIAPFRLCISVALALTALAPASHAQSSLDCGRDVCVDVRLEAGVDIVQTERTYRPGDNVTVAITYTMLAGFYPNGIEVAFDPSPYFLGSQATPPPDPSWTLTCGLDELDGSPWDFRCAWRSPLNFTVASDGGGNSQRVVVQLRSETFNAPDKYPGVMAATIRGERQGSALQHEHSDSVTARLDGQAHIYPSISQLSGGGIEWVQDDHGQYVRGRRYRYAVRPANTVPLATAAGVFTPPLTSVGTTPNPDHFSLLGVNGSNSLRDARYELTFPEPFRVLGFAMEANGVLSASTPFSYYAEGGHYRFDVQIPLGGSLPATGWATAPTATSNQAGGTTVDLFVPCLEENYGPIADRGDLSLYGNEIVVGGDPVAHASTGLRPIGAGLSIPSCDGVSFGTSAKGTVNSHVASGGLITWLVTFQPINGQLGQGDAAIIDYIPPYTEFVSTGSHETSTAPGLKHMWLGALDATQANYIAQDPSFGAPWLCRLDRRVQPPANIPPDCEVSPAPAGCYSGAPLGYSHRTPTTAEGGYPVTSAGDPLPDPLSLDLTLPFGAGGVGWNAALEMGCVRPADVCDPIAVDGTAGTIDYGGAAHCAGKKLRAKDVTALLWRTDGDGTPGGDTTPAIDGWRHPDWSPTNFVTVPPVYLRYTVRALPLDPTPLNHPRAAWTRNYARISGATFGPNDTPIEDAVSTTTPVTAYGALVQSTSLIDNRITPLITAGNSINPSATANTNPATTFYDPGGRAYVWGTFTQNLIPDQPINGGVFEVELPLGFDPVTLPPVAEIPGHLGFYGTGPFVDVTVVDGPPGFPAILDDAVRLTPSTNPTFAQAGWTQASFPTTVVWNASTERWTYRVTLPDGIKDGPSTYVNTPIAFGVKARVGYPFRDTALSFANFRLIFADYDDPADAGQTTYGQGDSNDIVKADVRLPVLYPQSISATIAPTCTPGNVMPSFDVRYQNDGGVSQYGFTTTFLVPTETEAGHAISLTDIVAPASGRPVGTTPVLEITTTSDGNFADPAGETWSTWASPQSLVGVRAVRLRFNTPAIPANLVPGGYLDGYFQVQLAVTDPIVGDRVTTSGRYGSSTFESHETEPSQPAVLGACPVSLTVTKWHDQDRDTTRDGGEILLPDIDFHVTRSGGLDLPTVVRDPFDGTTGDDGTFSVDVWPGQSVTITEPLPDPSPIAIPGYTGDAAEGFLTWAPTTVGGATQALTIGFVPAFAEFGNACTCTSDNLCVTPSECSVAIVAHQPVATCTFPDRDLTCDPSEAELCEVATGACDPTTGACGVGPKTCDEGAPTAVYVTVDDANGPIGVARCWVTAGAPTITCDTRDEGGRTVLDVQTELVCGSTPGGNP